MPRFFRLLAPILAAASMALSACGSAPEPSGAVANGPIVLAAASMQEALEEAADRWSSAGAGHARPVLSFASSAAVARQAAEGAPADVVVTADVEWMDWLEQRALLRAGSRRDIVGNALVLIAPIEAQPRLADGAARDYLRGYDGRLALAEPATVPAGRYAMASLTALGLADALAERIVPAENVRAALALVERGEAGLGIVYATDAAASDRVRVLARLPEDTHPPVRYPIALLAGSEHREAGAFADYVASPEGQAILARHGFTALP